MAPAGEFADQAVALNPSRAVIGGSTERDVDDVELEDEVTALVVSNCLHPSGLNRLMGLLRFCSASTKW